MTRPLASSDAERAEFFLALGRALSAGLSATQAMKALHGIADGALDPRLARVGSAVGKGTALPQALFRQGLLAERDRIALTAADDNGTLDRICERLARRYERSATRWRQLKGKLLLPGVVLGIAIIVAPLPAVAEGDLTPVAWLARSGALFTLLAVLLLVLRALVRRWRASGTPGWLTTVTRLIPGLAAMSRLHQRADVCEGLCLALAAGLPAGDALTAMRRNESNSVRREALAFAGSALAGGAGLADALDRAGLLDPPAFAIIATGEAAGRLEETLDRVASACHGALDDAYALLAQWVPVVLYVMVAGVVAAGLLG